MKTVQISLSRKFISYSVMVVLAVFIYISYIFIKEHSSQNDQIISNLSSEIFFAEKILDDSIKYTRLILVGMSNKISQNPTSKNHIKNTLESFRVLHEGKMNDILSISMFSWTDKKDQLIINSEIGILKKSKDLSSRDYLQITKKNPEKLYFGKPVIGAVSRQYIIPAGMGFVDDSGIYQGSIVMGFNIESIYRRFIGNKNFNNSDLQIIYKKDISIIKNDLHLTKNNLDKIDLRNNDIQILQRRSLFGPSSIVIYKRIPNTNYGFVVKHSLSNEYGILEKNYFLEFFSIISFLAILIYLLKRRFINPIVILSREARLVISGKIDIEIPKSNILEINQLSKSIISIRDFVQSEQFLKEELNVANLHLKSLTESISHDMRNYISGIIGLANIIYDLESKDDNSVIDKENNKKNVIKYAGMIRSQASHMLEFSRALISEGVEERIRHQKSTDVNKKNIDIGELLEELVFLNQPFIKTHNVCVNLDVEKNIPPIFANLIELRKILDNLITNAAKYSNEGGKINIKVEKFLNEEKKEAKADLLSTFKLSLKYKICVEISDQGIGMTEEEIEKALSGGGRKIDKTDLNKEIDSHGLGLPIVDKAVSNMGATMKIESKKGFGTTIKIWFEGVLNRDQASQNQELLDNKKIDISDIVGSGQDISSNYNDANSPTILIADDDQLIRSLTVHQLRNLGFKSIAVQNGVEAIKILDKQHFDLVLMDTNMEELNDGVKIVKIIREGSIFKNFKDFKTIPIIALSANIDRASKDVALISGMDDYLEKPLNQDKFLDIIRKYGFKSSISEKDSESSKD
ncbi:MAG: signal transduction histidine kinase/CheY-like chemotaxis protein [Rickettsiales bacterium]|jgi:signal transduction histidine kinase/CheY-like chemotaxis protein